MRTMRENFKIESMEGLVAYMGIWLDDTAKDYGENEHIEVHVDRVMGDVINLIKVTKALAQRVHDLESRK